MKEKIKLVKDTLVKLCTNLFNSNIGRKVKKVVNKALDIIFIRKPLRKANKFLKLLVQIPLGFIYICILIGILGSYHANHTFPDPNRPNVSLAQIQQEEIEAKKAKEEQDKIFAEQQKKEAEELAIKKDAEEKAKLEKEEAEKKVAEEAKRQEEQKKLEEEQKAQEAKKAEEERLQQEKQKQAQAEQEVRQAQQTREQKKTNQVQQSGGGYWIAASGGRVYHNRPNCRHMNHGIEVDLNYIQSNGLRPCKNCHH